MKKQCRKAESSAKFTKSDYLTIETIPNYTNSQGDFEGKIQENQLQVLFFCDILKQIRGKLRYNLHISILAVPLQILIRK